MTADSVNDAIEEQLVRNACSEVEQLVASGNRQAIETVLARLPSIADDDERLLELVYAEIVASEESGLEVSSRELRERFPQLASRIERLLNVHFAMDAAVFGDANDLDTCVRPQNHDTVSELSSEEKAGCQKVGDFEVGARLGRGAVGTVYRARQGSIGRTVAIKLLHGGDLSDDSIERFRREASATANLSHPNIVQIYAVGELDGRAYIAMEFLPGGTLAERIARQFVSDHDAAVLVAALADAIQHAHDRGVIHRDIKPANILLTDAGNPKIADFGLAHCLWNAGQYATRTGAVLGTPAYMAPEQADGKSGSISVATDVYSLGAVLYELLSGRCPFRGATMLETLEQVKSHEVIRPSQLQPRVAKDLETICLRCLQKEPGQRYRSARALAEDLRRFLNNEPIHARPNSALRKLVKWTRRRPMESGLIAVSLVIAMVGAMGIAWQWSRANTEARSANLQKQRALMQMRRAERALEQALVSERHAQRNFDEVRNLVDSLLGVSGRLTEQPQGSTIRMEILLDAYDSFASLLDERSTDPEYLSLMITLHQSLAGVCAEKLDSDQVRRYLDEAILLSRRLTNLYPNNTQYQLQKGDLHFQAAIFEKDLPVDLPVAAAGFLTAAECFRSVLAQDPNNAEASQSEAISLVNYANLLSQTDRTDEFDGVFRPTIQGMSDRLLARTDVSSNRRLTDFIRLASSSAMERPSTELEIEKLRRPLTHQTIDRLTHFALALESQGINSEVRQLPERAIENYRNSTALYRFLISNELNAPLHQALLARTQARIGRLLARGGDIEQAENVYRATEKTWLTLLESYPEKATYVESIIDVQYRLASIAVDAAKRSEIAAYVRASDHLPMSVLTLQDGKLGRELCAKLYDVAGNARLAGLAPEAQPAYERCLQVYRELASQSNATWSFEKPVGLVHYHLGRTLNDLAQGPAAVVEFDQAEQKLRPWLARSPDDIDVAKTISKSSRYKAFLTSKEADFDLAIDDVTKLCEADPKSAANLNNVAWLRLFHPNPDRREPDLSVQMSRQACELSPRNANLLHTFALCLCRARQFSGATEAIERAIAAKGRETCFHRIVKVLILIGQGNPGAAQQLLAKCDASALRSSSDQIAFGQLYAEAAQQLDGLRSVP